MLVKQYNVIKKYAVTFISLEANKRRNGLFNARAYWESKQKLAVNMLWKSKMTINKEF